MVDNLNQDGSLIEGREDDKKLKVDFRSIPCKVCKAPSSGFHFGAITCEGCKVGDNLDLILVNS